MLRNLPSLLAIVLAPCAACSSCDRPEPPPAQRVEDPATAASRLLERAERIAASAERSDTESSACGQAWSELAAMDRADGGLPSSFPTREVFESRCVTLPPEVQRCLRISVSLREPERCRLANQALSETERSVLESIMDGNPLERPDASVPR